jgi:hypothetical protein
MSETVDVKKKGEEKEEEGLLYPPHVNLAFVGGTVFFMRSWDMPRCMDNLLRDIRLLNEGKMTEGKFMLMMHMTFTFFHGERKLIENFIQVIKGKDGPYTIEGDHFEIKRVDQMGHKLVLCTMGVTEEEALGRL